MPVVVFEDDLRVQVALVLHDQLALVAAGVLLQPHRLAFDDVLEADLAADFGENRDGVRVPLAEHGAGHDFLVLVDHQVGAGGDFVLLQLAALGVEDEDFAVAGEHDLLAGVVADDLHAGELDHALLLGLDLALFDVAGGRAADVERTHRQLRARLADALGGDDAHGHAFLDQRAGGEVHAVAQAQMPSAASQVIGLRTWIFSRPSSSMLAGDLDGDQVVFLDDHFVGDRVDDVRAADAAADRVARGSPRPFRRGRSRPW